MPLITSRDGGATVPFEASRLDLLMEQTGINVLLATSKHNTQYLLGGYRFIFFSAMDAIGHSRYLPVVVYEKGRLENAAYVANRMEGGEHHNHPFWTPAFHAETWGTLDAAARAAEHLRKIGKADAQSEQNRPFFQWTLRPAAGTTGARDIRGRDRHVGYAR